MDERSRLIEEIGDVMIRLLILGLPGQTSSLLDYDLTLQQTRVFAFVMGHGPTSISTVAEALGIRPNVATGIIQRLVTRGLIERREDPDDRRARLLTVTERGRALIEETAGVFLVQGRRLLERLSDEQLREARDFLVASESQSEVSDQGLRLSVWGAE
jgi:DNA-binding MarR family transcriptional regulator